uniref:UBIQUITIN_CONJUGAT_2 domain-containing protein n=1 Tax=Elaeophora elaphi TaxID=1147741 RepID=A0A0R3S5U8_9BILA
MLGKVIRISGSMAYNVGGYKIEIEFTKEYPAKPLKIKFLTKVYHPNVSETGEVSLALALNENWRPPIKLLCSPQLECVLRPELAGLYVKDADACNKNAPELCKHYSETNSTLN